LRNQQQLTSEANIHTTKTTPLGSRLYSPIRHALNALQAASQLPYDAVGINAAYPMHTLGLHYIQTN